MYRVNFCERTPGTRVREALYYVLSPLQRPFVRVLFCALAAGVVFASIESSRLMRIMSMARQVETQRDRLAFEVQRAEASARTVRQKQLAVVVGRRLQSSSVGLASTIARLGNALGPRIVLTKLRGRDNGIEIEGRGPTFADVRLVLEHLSAAYPRPGEPTVFEARRDGAAPRYVTFRLDLTSGVGEMGH